MLKGYVSEIDQYLEEFDRTHSLTASQQAEIKKYAQIHQWRDYPHTEKTEDDIWG